MKEIPYPGEYIDTRGVWPIYVRGQWAIALEGQRHDISVAEARKVLGIAE